jgi:hypothetical protein
MMLPTKHLPLEKSALGVAVIVSRYLPPRTTISELWDRLAADPLITSFDQLVLGLDVLNLMGLVNYDGGWLVRSDAS